MKRFLTLISMALPLTMMSADATNYPTVGSIERLDPAFDALVAADAKIEKLAEGFTWSEGPVWLDGTLLFSDVPENVIHRWTPGRQGADVFLKPSGMLTPKPGFREQGSNGLARDAQGRLLICQHGERRVARYAGGKFTSIADRFEGKQFNSPNDLALHSSGAIYFTDPPYGLEGVNDSPLKELPFNGVFRVSQSGEVTLLSKTLTYPNGIAFSPDEKFLYIGVSDGKATRVVAYDVKADGTLANERTFFDAQPRVAAGDRGGCDGLKVDRNGNVWATGPGGVLVISPAGKLLGVIRTGQLTANCGWGDDGSTLYITADSMVVKLKTLTKGAGW
jgi:gluconolactonase